jgi:lambda family phage portal protein
MHTYRMLRPGQVRGVPWLAPVMLALRDLDDYRDAERLRKKTEACLAGIVTRPEGASGLPVGSRSTDARTGNMLERMYPGMIEYLKPGEDIRFNSPAATGGYREYLMAELQGVGAGVDVPYELLSGDLSNVNYSSYRAGMLCFRNAIEAFRWLTLIPMFCRPAWRRFIDVLVALGRIPEANYGVQWTAQKFESVDPLKDALSELKRIRTGTLTLSEAISQNGYDPEKQLLEIKRLNDLMDRLGLILDCDPRKVNDKGVEQTGAFVATGTDEPRTKGSKNRLEFARTYRS